MTEALALASGPITEVYKDGRNLITSFYYYAKNLEKNHASMTGEAAKIYARRDDYEAEAKKDRGKQLTKQCERWMKEVVKIDGEVGKLESKYMNEIKHQRPWPRFRQRAKLSEELAEMCEKLRIIFKDGEFNTGILVGKLPDRVKKIHGPKIVANTSRHAVVQDIVGSLRDKDVKRIGLWGIPGVGKTTILENLNDDANIEHMFEIVIWVTQSRNQQSIKEMQHQNIKEVQHAIVQRLKLNTKDCSIDETACIISEELESRKYLLILDEVSCDLKLHAIGIRENQTDGKMVFAASNKHTCYDMAADRLINVKPLSNADAWDMFSSKIGPSIDHPGIRSIAEEVVIECAGLPLVIDRVAMTFRRKNRDVALWECGLENLRLWPSIKNQGLNEVLEVLKFCYEDLDGEDQKNCFLYIALYPEDRKICIDYLLECWNAEGFIHGARLLKDARRKGHEIVDDLINVSLLERLENKKYIKMNKMLRNMALKISSQRESFVSVVKSGEGLKDPLNEEEWERANRISLTGSDLCRLPESPKCNSLLTLLLQKNGFLNVIPEGFFKSMANLRVLDLHGTAIISLPTTISQLVGLKVLYLNSCQNLTKFPSLTKEDLQLEVLDIRGTGIKNIPLEVGTFSQLKCFRMSLSNSVVGQLDQGQLRLAKINRNVISRLLLLEELSIDVYQHNHGWNEVIMAITSEVASLKHLASLSFCFPGVDSLQAFITESSLWKNFRFMFQFSLGYHDLCRNQILHYFDYQLCKCFKYANGDGVHPAILNVLAETEAFELISHKGVSRLSDFGIQNMSKMRSCSIESCTEIETIIDGHNVTEAGLICLEKMYVTDVPNLISIWEGPVHAGSLALLTNLNLLRCASLKKIFSNGMIQQLSQLQHLKVEECLEIEELIMVSENGGLQPDSLLKLKTLALLDLPKLTSIWDGDHSLEWPSLERIQILSCNLLKKLPFQNDNATRLISIEGQQAWWSSLEWQDQSAEQRLRSICILK